MTYPPQGPGPGWQQRPHAFPAPPPPATHRNRGPLVCLFVTLGCGGLSLVMVLVAVLVGGLTLGGGGSATEAPTAPTTTASTTQTPTTGRPTTSPSMTEPPASRSHPTDVAFANDAYQPPAARPGSIIAKQAGSAAEAAAMTQQSSLYTGRIASPVRCPNDPIMSDPNLTEAQLKAGVERHIGCLMRVWQPVAAKAGIELLTPNVVLFTGSVESACGTLSRLNYYCSDDTTMYLQADPPTVTNADGQVTYRMEHVTAHEFAHHLQATFGILQAAWSLVSRGSADEQLESSRRIELQADCFAAVAWTATSYSQGGNQSDVDMILEVAGQLGDHPDRNGDHGKSASAVLWTTRGLQGKQPAACNTFVAPASEVR